MRFPFILPIPLLMAAGLLLPSTARGGCIAPETDAAVFDKSRAVAEVEVISSESYISEDRALRTRVLLRLVERFKGDVPERFEITTAGGSMAGRTDFRSDSLPLVAGESYILLLSQRGATASLSSAPPAMKTRRFAPDSPATSRRSPRCRPIRSASTRSTG